MVQVISQQSPNLAQRAVDETGFGKVMDKMYKNHAASTLLYDEIKHEKQ